jgi:hypothetical protein
MTTSLSLDLEKLKARAFGGAEWVEGVLRSYHTASPHLTGLKTTPPLPGRRIKTKKQIQRTFDRRTGEMNGSLSGSARFTLLLTHYGQ